jgi:hypothetical protein
MMSDTKTRKAHSAAFRMGFQAQMRDPGFSSHSGYFLRV